MTSCESGPACEGGSVGGCCGGDLPGLLIALPQGLGVSGVNTWAVRLVGELARRGRRCGLIVHDEPEWYRGMRLEVPAGVRVFDARGLAGFGEAGCDWAGLMGVYRGAVRELAGAADRPVVVSPNLHGDCYGLFAAMCVTEPELLRVVGVQHSDIEYDRRLLMHYEPMLSAFVPVSAHMEGVLNDRLGDRSCDVARVPYGVEVCDALPTRSDVAGRAMRLVYTGRFEHTQKRVMALVSMSDALSDAGVAHELLLVGEGPADEVLRKAAAERPSIRVTGATDGEGVRAALDWADVFVLSSRYEGLCVSMLEAMGRGCAPVVARVDSGAEDAIERGESGLIVDVDHDEMSDAEVGVAMAGVIAGLRRDAVRRMGEAAHRRARSLFDLSVHADAWSALIDRVAGGAARMWPMTRACAFSGGGGSMMLAGGGLTAIGGSGSVPADGESRLVEVLRSLAGRRVVIHGTGQHTRQLASVLADAPCTIVGFTDDDANIHGKRLWHWPIVPPGDAVALLGATDVVISSWMHEPAIWNRRRVYESRGLRVHRLYADAGTETVESTRSAVA